jgi:transcriptional regulator with XRE-family HTH domain
MDPARALREARRRTGLTQSELADRTGTSQATVSAYETSAKGPSVATLSRLLAAMGVRLVAEPGGPRVRTPSAQDHAGVARRLLDVLTLAEALPTRHEQQLGFPRLSRSPARGR